MKRSIYAALPSLDSLIIFEQAAHYQSFTKAGNYLGLTQSAVSRQMIDLEQLLQVELFARKRQRIKLTSAGAEFRELVRPIIHELRAATLRMQMQRAQSRVLNMSVAVSFCNLWFIHNLPAYYAEPDAAQVNIVPHIGRVSLVAGAIDAAIVNSASAPDDCESVKLADIEVAPFASRSLLKHLGIRTLAQFDTIPAIEIQSMPNVWPKYLAKNGLPQKKIELVGSQSLFLSSYEAALAGLGVALLPIEFVGTAGRSSELRQLHPSRTRSDRAYYFCWPKLSSKSEAVHSMRIWLERTFKRTDRTA
ncbi:MAG: LysR family transcriptional regulator [Pseudomonas sp.]